MSISNENAINRLQHQLDQLQSQLAFQEDALQALDNVVTRQQRQIENLNEQLQAHQLQLARLDGSDNGVVGSERPPHY